jgi:hypothetical protein
MTAACLAVAVAATSAGAAGPSTSAIARHPNLDRAATVWCIEHQIDFKAAAEALGINAGGGTIEDRIDRHGLTTVLAWAESDKALDISDFDDACKLAYSPFAKPAVDPHTAGQIATTASALKNIADHDRKTGISSDALFGLLGVVIGAVLVFAFGFLQAVSNRHHRDGDGLTALNDAWRTDLAAHVVDNRSGEVARRAQVSGLRLRDALARWKEGRQKQDAEDAMTEIDKLLLPGPGQTKSPPYIGQVNDVDQVNDAAERITRLVSAVAADISHLIRDGPARHHQ